MRRSPSLVWKVFYSILAVAVVSLLATGFFARVAVQRAFRAYLFPPEGMPRMPGTVQRIGAAEQAFLDASDQGLVLAALLAAVIAAMAAVFLARYLAGPLAKLTSAAQALAAGDLEHRVEVEGPAEVERLADAFNEMAASLEEGESLRRRLVADVAHELRNPVAALRAQTEGMAEGVLATDDARLTSIQEDVAHLSRLVDDLQELSAAEAGRMQYLRGRIDLAALVAREVERASLQVAAGVEVELSLPEGSVSVEADERRVAQVLRNLLGNAARHTTAGAISVSVRERGFEAVVEVSDSGEGIPEEDLPYIFERFYRADSSRSAASGGAGIGLAISRMIVVDHGGDVFVSSAPGKGTTIGFTLPLDAG